MTARTTLVALLAVGSLAACGDDGGGGDRDAQAAGPLDDFRLTAPDGFDEIAPSETATITWTVTASDAYGLELGVRGSDDTAIMIERRTLAPGTLTWDGRHPGGGPPAVAGNYHVYASALGPDDGAVQTIDGGAEHLIVVQGARFRDATLSFTGGQTPRDIVLSTVTRSTYELTLAIDPDVEADGDERPLVHATIPGELAPVLRSYPFTGMDTSGQPIAAGTYAVVALISARNGNLRYRADGPTLTWAP